jgi:hypothetical protein
VLFITSENDLYQILSEGRMFQGMQNDEYVGVKQNYRVCVSHIQNEVEIMNEYNIETVQLYIPYKMLLFVSMIISLVCLRWLYPTGL